MSPSCPGLGPRTSQVEPGLQSCVQWVSGTGVCDREGGNWPADLLGPNVGWGAPRSYLVSSAEEPDVPLLTVRDVLDWRTHASLTPGTAPCKPLPAPGVHAHA